MKNNLWFVVMLLFVVACSDKKNDPRDRIMKAVESASDILAGDSTIYGVCGTGTMMHTLQLITDKNDTINVNIDDEYDEDGEARHIVVGGMLCGDRMAVIAEVRDAELSALKIINMTALLGRWISLDKNFVLEENGRVVSDIANESNSWNEWRLYNGRLLLGTDTFDVINISADTLSLENNIGIYEYRRYGISN